MKARLHSALNGSIAAVAELDGCIFEGQGATDEEALAALRMEFKEAIRRGATAMKLMYRVAKVENERIVVR